jgi:CBS domain-containing protein
MTSDIFTVQPGDVVDLAASLMEWEHIRFVPVEDQNGKLVGLVTYRELMRVLARGGSRDSVAVQDIMKRDLITASPTDSAVGAMETMRKHKVGCLPVVRDGKLVGIVTEHDFVEISKRLLKRWLSDA